MENTNQQRTALLVEDHEGIREGLQDRLEYLGYKVTPFTQADEASAKIVELKSEGKKPDLLVTDHNTPGTMTGLQLLEQIKNEGIKSIIWTAGFNKEFEHKAREAGALAAIDKPNFDKLIAKLNELARNPNIEKSLITR